MRNLRQGEPAPVRNDAATHGAGVARYVQTLMGNARLAAIVFFAVVVPGLAAQRPSPSRPDSSKPASTQPADVTGKDQDKKDEKAEVDKLISDGLAAWRAGDEQKAADLLQQATSRIQARAARKLGSFLPTKAEGFTFDAPHVDSGSFGGGETAMQWSTAQVRATRTADEKQVQVQITNSPQMFQGMQAMVTVQAQMKEILKQQGTDIDVQTKHGFQVVTIVDQGNANAWILGKRLAITITIDDGDRATLAAAVGWLDLAGLKTIDGE